MTNVDDDGAYRYLWICGTCRHLKEIGRPDGMEQRCTCPSERESVGGRWPGCDINERAILCRCCGLEALRSGSRWSPFFCRECQLLSMGVSVWNRRLIFPIGRHTIMHSWVPKSAPPSMAAHGGDASALTETVYASMQTVFKGSDGLWEWYPFVMAYNLRRLGFERDVRLSEYLAAVEQEELAVLSQRLTRFEGLCEFFKHGTMAIGGGRE